MPSSPALIKGYFPLRVSLPSDGGDTFLFLKEHIGGGDDGRGSGTAHGTLFVANAPLVPGVRTRLFLRSLFGRFGDVERVSVVRNPRSLSSTDDVRTDELLKMVPNFIDDEAYNDEGKFAHVVFESPKALRKALRGMRGAMKGDKKSGRHGVVSFGNVEIQELVDESKRFRRREVAEAKGADGDGEDDSETFESDVEGDDNIEENGKPKLTGILALADRYRASFVSRSSLMDACNAVMSKYEEAEEAERQARTASAEPDDDGFVTVTYSQPVVGSKRELEEDVGGRRRKGTSKRTRRKKESIGASELKDFYRFQMKETRKKGLQDLRHRFEEDLAKVKRMKEEKQYKPF